MSEASERRAASAAGQPGRPPAGSRWSARLRPRSMAGAIVLAVGSAVLAAIAWALLRGILELSIGLLAVAALGGWAIGALLREVHGSALVAGVIAAAGWAVGLLLTWLVALAILPGSARTFLERIESTPFVDWLSPQFGWLEIAALLTWIGAAAYASRPSARTGS